MRWPNALACLLVQHRVAVRSVVASLLLATVRALRVTALIQNAKPVTVVRPRFALVVIYPKALEHAKCYVISQAMQSEKQKALCMQQKYLQSFTFTLVSLSVKRVASAAASRADTGVTANRVVAPLRVHAIVIAQQAFVNV